MTEDGVYYSETLNGFIPEAWKDDGSYSDETWPADAVLLTDEEKSTYWKQNAPEGKKLGGVNGRPEWVDIPEPTKDEYISSAVEKKKDLLQEVNTATQIWQTQLALGMISDDDKSTLILWMKYAQQVQAINTSLAPEITWPEKPS
ncbi:tail fiber assembly protein [Lonsdalea quercina]|uniref:tail fiber assembly protein n=1 Tax=Lonsdalea quercina TaxID=71657 RepID=UPI0039750C88